jgi:hypothetical protein
MPIEVQQKPRHAEGAYAFVGQGLEKELGLHRFYFGSTPFGAQKQVDDVRAGQPVRVTARWLPPGTYTCADVVIVYPDDRIEETDDSWAAQWLAEEGL